MNTNVTPTAHGSRSNTLVWLLASVLGVTLITAAVIFIGNNQSSPSSEGDDSTVATESNVDDGTGDASPATPALPPPDPAEPAPPTATGQLATTEASEIVEHIISVPFAHAETPDELSTVLASVAQDNYLAELANQWQELAVNGWSVEGTPKVLYSEITEATETTAQVTACIDASAVRTLDATGAPIGEPTSSAALHNFTLEQDDTGHWRITGHSFPNDPACS